MISIIVAVAENGVIGKKGAIPWHLPADLKHFKEVTMGHTVIMGRVTFESIIDFLGKPLPNRKNIVVSSQTFSDYDVEVVSSFQEAKEKTNNEEMFVIGGSRLYAEALPEARKLYLTRVHENIEGDVMFPEFDENDWKLVDEEKHKKDDKNKYDYSFLTYERR